MNFFDDAIHNILEFDLDKFEFWKTINSSKNAEELSELVTLPFFKKLHEKTDTLNVTQVKKDIFRVANGIKRIRENPGYYENQVKFLQTQPQPAQRTEPWYKMREGMVTASDWGTAIGENPNSTINKLLLKKLGYPGEQFTGNIATRWGTKYEQVANDIYEFRNKVKVIEFGLIQHPKILFLGASPDGITADGIMLEIKCPWRRVINGIPPRYYWVQVQGQLEVCDLERCDFLECKLIEYENPSDYFNDIDLQNPGKCLSTGNEMGIVLEFSDHDNQLSFEYSSLGINVDDSNNWMKDKIIEHRKQGRNFKGASYWKLDFLSCVPIYRDREWFKNTLPKLESFLKEWNFYKKVGYESLLTKKKLREKPKSKSKKVEMDLTKYAGFVTDNFGNNEDKVINNDQLKLYEGVISGVPISGFGFSQETILEEELTDNSDRSTDSIEKQIKKIGFGFSDNCSSPKVKKSISKFGFSDDCSLSKSTKQSNGKKSKKSTSQFGFSIDSLS